MDNECIVSGCTNKKHEGVFVGEICKPCYTHITTGIVGPSTSFIGDMKNKIVYQEELISTYDEAILEVYFESRNKE